MSESFISSGFDWNPCYSKAFSNGNSVPLESECGADVTLRLDSACYNPKWSRFIGAKRKRGECVGAEGFPEHASLALGLGRSSSSSDISKGVSDTACTITSVGESADEESFADLGFNFQLHIGSSNDNNACSKRPEDAPKETVEVFDLQLSLSTGLPESTVTDSAKIATEEEGSASSVPTAEETRKSSVSCTSGKAQRNCSRSCQFEGCTKGARGASGLCIAHGGGRRCQKAGCHKGAEGKTAYCKAHGGGRRCQHLGCTKSAEGRTEYCIAHGGGRRCRDEGCTRAARGKSGLCIRHGGGKRCQKESCCKSAEGFSGLCISHGGGRRCQFPACTKGAQGSTVFCKSHGGGKRCAVLGCTKGAEGSTPLCKAHGGGKRCSFQGGGVCSKSVHGGTLFCVAHGGGKRCAFSGCTKSARGRTNFCVRHGGGKRCKSNGCGKSAQGSTDHCKAHGGGKRCSWGQPGFCDRFARGKIGLCCLHGGSSLSLLDTASPHEQTVKLLPDLSVLPEGRVHGGCLMAMLSSSSYAMAHEWV